MEERRLLVRAWGLEEAREVPHDADDALFALNWIEHRLEGATHKGKPLAFRIWIIGLKPWAAQANLDAGLWVSGLAGGGLEAGSQRSGDGEAVTHHEMAMMGRLPS